jgi:hypothetical protein
MKYRSTLYVRQVGSSDMLRSTGLGVPASETPTHHSNQLPARPAFLDEFVGVVRDKGRRHLKVTSHPDEKRLCASHKAAEHRSTSLVNLHLVSPPRSGAHSGKSVYNMTASMMTALESN